MARCIFIPDWQKTQDTRTAQKNPPKKHTQRKTGETGKTHPVAELEQHIFVVVGREESPFQ